MFQHQGIWFPDGEKHFPDWMTRNGEIVDGRGTYQIKKFRAAMESVKQFRTAIDVGGHVGLWSIQMRARFQIVHAFEPMAKLRDCFSKNVDESNVLLHPVALGAEAGFAHMNYNPADSGGTHVKGKAEPDSSAVKVETLDAYDLQDVDFIKIDCEGYEHLVVLGAKETIERWRPTMIVEQKPRKLAQNYGAHGQPALDILRRMGAEVVRELGGDFILRFP